MGAGTPPEDRADEGVVRSWRLPDIRLSRLPARRPSVTGQTIDSLLGATDRANLLAFLKSIDGRTNIFQSQADCFKSPACNL